MNAEKRIAELENRIRELEQMVADLQGQLGSDSDEDKGSFVVASYDFSNAAELKNSGWKIANAEEIDCDSGVKFKSITVERTLGVFFDPMLINYDLNIPAENVSFVRVKIKSNVDASQKCILRVFFTTATSPDWSQSKSVCCEYAAGRSVDVCIETKNRFWNGVIKQLRLDPVEGLKGSIEIETIELLDSDNSVVYKVDFTKADGIANTGWVLRNVVSETCNGVLRFDVDILEKKRVYTDPFLFIDNIEIDISRAKYLHLQMQVDLDDDSNTDVYMQILFKTKSSNFWTQDKSMRFDYTPGKKIDAYVRLKQLFWKGTLVALRIDPFENLSGTTQIFGIELLSELPEDKDVEILKARTRRLEDRFNRIYNY